MRVITGRAREPGQISSHRQPQWIGSSHEVSRSDRPDVGKSLHDQHTARGRHLRIPPCTLRARHERTVGLHTCWVIFTIYADLDVGRPVHTETATFGAVFRPDEDACIWTDERRPNTLQVSYDIDVDVQADDFQSAIEASLAELRAVLATMPFDARPVSITAMTDEAQATWTE